MQSFLVVLRLLSGLGLFDIIYNYLYIKQYNVPSWCVRERAIQNE